MAIKENWLNENLCSFDEKVRVELGPQIIEMECNDDNLSDAVTESYYQTGGRDAYGRVIRKSVVEQELDKHLSDKSLNPAQVAVARKLKQDLAKDTFGAVENGEMMAVVDRQAKLAPMLWKIYQNQDTGRVYEKDQRDGINKVGEPIMRFVKVDEREDRDEALAIAKNLAEGM
ncbi:MAG: hypothetical protein PVI43_00155 [Candidatus Bathyarchaeota archaeon]|jgi:hypothetical protein